MINTIKWLGRVAVVMSLTLVADPAAAQRIVIEAESLVPQANASSGAVSVQNMSGFGGGWSNGAQLFWRAPDPGGGPLRNAPRLTLTINVAIAGEYLVAIRHTKAPDYGNVSVFIGGNSTGRFDGFSSVSYTHLTLPTIYSV